jgi:hypothetical protein
MYHVVGCVGSRGWGGGAGTAGHHVTGSEQAGGATGGGVGGLGAWSIE